eukprot:12106841-Ditylum_brightwellii.AAC.1
METLWSPVDITDFPALPSACPRSLYGSERTLTITTIDVCLLHSFYACLATLASAATLMPSLFVGITAQFALSSAGPILE